MKNKAFIFTLLVPLLLLSGCNSNLSYVKKILKNANYSFKIDTQSKRRSSQPKKRNKLSLKSSIINKETKMLEIDFDNKIDIDGVDFFQSFNEQLSLMSDWAKQFSLKLVEETKRVEDEAKNKGIEPSKSNSVVYYNKETKEINTFTKMLPSYISIHIYYDEDGNEVVEYTTYSNRDTRFAKIIYNPEKECNYTYGTFENGALFTDTIKTQKVDNQWIGFEYSYQDGEYSHGENVETWTQYHMLGAQFFFQLNGYDYQLSSVYDWKDKTNFNPSDSDLYETNPLVSCKYGALCEGGVIDETTVFLFRETAFDGVDKEFIDIKDADHIRNEKNDIYCVQTIKDNVLPDDRSYSLTKNGKEIHSTFIFDTEEKAFVDEENKNTIVGEQSTISAARGELYEGTFNDYTIGQHDTYINFGKENLQEGKRRINSFLDYCGLTISEGLNQNYINDLFDIYENAQKYEEKVTNYFIGSDYNYSNLLKMMKSTNLEVHQEIENLKNFIIN